MEKVKQIMPMRIAKDEYAELDTIDCFIDGQFWAYRIQGLALTEDGKLAVIGYCEWNSDIRLIDPKEERLKDKLELVMSNIYKKMHYDDNSTGGQNYENTKY